MFEKASRLRLRFESSKGELTVEQLWDLPLTSEKTTSLDTIAISLREQLKEAPTMSFVKKSTSKNEILQLKFDIVKHIIDVLMAEAEAKVAEKHKAQQREKLDELISQKETTDLAGKSVEELKAMRAAL